jgi:hypothetical protein
MLVGGFLSQSSTPTMIWNLSDLGPSYTDSAAATQTYAVEVSFRTDATVDIFKDVGSNQLDEQVEYVSPTSGVSDTWVACSYVSGDDIISGLSKDTWYNCSSIRTWRYAYTSTGGTDLKSGVYTFKLSSDSSGTVVEATQNVTLTAGETI